MPGGGLPGRGTARLRTTPVLRPSSISSATDLTPDAVEAMRHPLGEHHIPDAYATSDLLV